MANLSALITRFADCEFVLRRLYVQDPGFRAICDDYVEAQTAERRWKQAGAAGRASDYRQLADELAEEIRAALDAMAARSLRT